MKNKTKNFTFSLKKKCQTFGILMLLSLLFGSAKAQPKFELSIIGNTGYYFTEGSLLGYNIKNGLQFGVGSQLNYIVNTKTKIGLGFNFNYIKTSEKTYYSPSPLIPDLSAIEVPVTINREILKNWFVTAGAAACWHSGSNKPVGGVLGKWELGVGYHFDKLAISLNYSQNFKNHEIQIIYEDSNHFGSSEYKRKILSLKLEYPLWKF